MRAYHSDSTRWGSSMLAVFRRAPATAFRFYVAKDLEPPPPSAAMILGSLVHLHLLEPERLQAETVVVPVAGKTAKAYRNAVERYPDKLVVTEPEALAAAEMSRAVLEPQTEGAEIARALLRELPGALEYSYRWDDALGVPLKVRFDRLVETARGAAQVNLKTSSDPSSTGFARLAFTYGYPEQAALYERGFLHLTGGVLPDTILVVIHNEAPWEVSVKQPTEEWMEIGRRQIKADLTSLGQLLENPNRAAWAAPWETGIEPLEPPPWGRLGREDHVYDTF